MKLSVDLGRWTATRVAIAVAGVLTIAGAVGSALAISPTISPPIKWQGGVEFEPGRYAPGLFPLYTVPSGRNFLLTDLIVSNRNATENYVSILTAASNCNSPNKSRLGFVFVPAKQTLHIPLVTGFGFTAGQRVCLSVGQAGDLDINGRGFLFTPS